MPFCNLFIEQPAYKIKKTNPNTKKADLVKNHKNLKLTGPVNLKFSCVCDLAQLWDSKQHKAVLIIFPLILQTITTAQKWSTGVDVQYLAFNTVSLNSTKPSIKKLYGKNLYNVQCAIKLRTHLIYADISSFQQETAITKSPQSLYTISIFS